MIIQNNFFIVRHGESENNLLGIQSTKLENKEQFGLTKAGKEATILEAQKFKFDLIFCSPFRRARETAQIFADFSKCNLIEEDSLKEVFVGEYELKDNKEVELFSKKYGDEVPFPNGESLSQVKKRVIQFFKKINKEHKNKNILIVTHGYLVKVLLSSIYKNLKWEEYIKKYENSRKVFEVDSDVINSSFNNEITS